MARLSEKYIAGFLDADGSIGIVFHEDTKIPQLRLGFSQKTSQDEVLYLIQDSIGGNMSKVTIGGYDYSRLTFSGNRQIKMLLNRIRKFLVVKRHYADVCLDVCERQVEDIPKLKEYLNIQRKIKSLPLPNYPSRKWMAGYLDGDGCFSVSRIQPYGGANLILHVAASNFDTEGVEIIQNAFGGNIYNMGERVKQYTLALNPSKVREMFPHFCKYMIVKNDQARFILGCAEMGHFKPGIAIKSALKQLKARQHRLSEPKADISQMVSDCYSSMRQSEHDAVCIAA